MDLKARLASGNVLLAPGIYDGLTALVAQQAGFEAYVVGGAVRDLLPGLRPKDFDVATNATPEQVKGLFRRAFIIGRRFRIVHVVYGRGREHEVIEVSTFRAYLDNAAADLLRGVPGEWRGGLVAFASLLFVLIALLLLVACVNVASLLVARGEARRHEFAMRHVLGASRARVILQLMSESAVLAFAAGALGLALSEAACRVLSKIDPPVPVPLAIDVSIDAAALKIFVVPVQIALQPVPDEAGAIDPVVQAWIDDQLGGDSKGLQRLVHLFAANQGNIEIQVAAEEKCWRVNPVRLEERVGNLHP